MTIRAIAATMLAALILALPLAGCGVVQNLDTVKHADDALSAGGGTANTERFRVERDGQVFNRTYSGNGDPSNMESNGQGVLSLYTEGPIGGANFVIPSENPQAPPTIMQMVGQNDLTTKNVTITLADGTTIEAEEFAISASETRRARAEALDRWVEIRSLVTQAQEAAIEGDTERFNALMDELGTVLNAGISSLVTP